MGIFGRLFGKSGGTLKQDESIELEVEREAGQVVKIDEKVIALINYLNSEIDAVLASMETTMEKREYILLGGYLRDIKRELIKVLETKSASKEYTEIVRVYKLWTSFSEFMRKRDHMIGFETEWMNLRTALTNLINALKIKKELLSDEFAKIKSEQ